MSDKFELLIYPGAIKDIKKLDGSKRQIVAKAIEKVLSNPFPQDKGGYGKPLGNKAGLNLTGYLKIKLKGSGIRIVYRLVEVKGKMVVVVVGSREDDEVYKIAAKRAADFEAWLKGAE